MSELAGCFLAIALSVGHIAGPFGNAGKVEHFWQAFMAFCIIFAVARFIHTILYAIAAPHMARSAFYFIAVLAIIAAGILAVIAAFE